MEARLKHLRPTGIGTNTRRRKQRRGTSPGHGGSNQTGQPKQSCEPGVACARRHEDDCTQTNSDATVRPVTLPEGWTVVVNSLRQVVYCHVNSGMACFQMPENPELLNDLKFENGSSSVSGDSSQKRRSDCKRKVSNHSEQNKLKISRGDHPNQVMVKSPSCWIDPFQARLNKRCTTKITRTAEPLSRDVIELKQSALWHGGKTRIDQASEAAAEGMARQPKASRIPFRSEGVSSSSVLHQERATSSQTSHPPSCASSSSAVELPRMSGGTCKEQSATDACVAATVRRDLKEPVAPVERSGTFRWRRFQLLTYLVVTASTAQSGLMTQDEICEW